MNKTDYIAVAALVLSLIALFWQFWTWRRSGPVIRVTGGVESPWDPAGFTSDLCYGYVRAVNAGRGAAPITSWGFLSANGQVLVEYSSQLEMPLIPARGMHVPIAPSAQDTWYCPLEVLMGQEGYQPFVVSPTKGRIVGRLSTS
ncbi:hypothetical protein [Streptomyces sp. NPDC053728]|uniref:hypothetical protein n=1 Tax=Streptomyces sp. NPDC053728 TaxID=3155534 RepID=UPI00342AB67B